METLDQGFREMIFDKIAIEENGENSKIFNDIMTIIADVICPEPEKRLTLCDRNDDKETKKIVVRLEIFCPASSLSDCYSCYIKVTLSTDELFKVFYKKSPDYRVKPAPDDVMAKIYNYLSPI